MVFTYMQGYNEEYNIKLITYYVIYSMLHCGPLLIPIEPETLYL